MASFFNKKMENVFLINGIEALQQALRTSKIQLDRGVFSAKMEKIFCGQQAVKDRKDVNL